MHLSVSGITPLDSASLLGVIIDKLLNGFEHIDNLSTKFSSITFAFRVLVLVVDQEVILQMYYLYV